MIDFKWLILLLGLLVVLLAHGIYSVMGAARAREVLDVASDSIATLIDERVPMEMREDSLRLVVEAQRQALQADSVRWVRELEEANERAQRARARASTLVDTIRVRADSTTLQLVDSLVVEHSNETSALESQLTIVRLENVSLRTANASLTELSGVLGNGSGNVDIKLFAAQDAESAVDAITTSSVVTWTGSDARGLQTTSHPRLRGPWLRIRAENAEPNDAWVVEQIRLGIAARGKLRRV